MANRVAAPPVILGIVGDSGAGKTTLGQGVAEIIGTERVTFLSIDDYHRYSRAERLHRGLAAADPESNHLDIAEQHLHLLRRGEPVLRPSYDHAAGEPGPPVYVEPKPYLIVDGLLAFATPRLRESFDVKVFLEPDEELRVCWKTRRDMANRGYTPDEVRETIYTASVAAARFVQPQRAHADIVVVSDPRDDDLLGDGDPANVNMRYILRPTLPNLISTPLLQTGASEGVNLELSRDLDGKPIDVLEVSGDISGDSAERLEGAIWDLIPESSPVHDAIGRYGGGPESTSSHTLALTQLLVAYHLEHAVIGRRD